MLKNVLRSDLYDHFMTISVAMCLLVGPDLAKVHVDYAHQLLVYFVQQGRKLYGAEFLIYNVHSMLHLADDVKELGHLDNFSAFPFENYLQHLKRVVRSGKGVLGQIVRRLGEMDAVKITRRPTVMTCDVKAPNNAYLLDDNSCCDVLQAIDASDKYMIKCRIYERSSSLFDHPCDSTIIGAYIVNTKYSKIRIIPATKLKTRAVRIERSNNLIFLAILHAY